VAVLLALGDAPDGLGTNEIARRTGVNASTVSRLLSTLAEDGLVHRADGGGPVRLGPRLVELGNAALAGLGIRELARPHLVELAEATGETATLSLPAEEATFTVDYVQSSSSVRSVAEVGRPSVLHATATGKVLLAHREGVPAGRLAAYTPRTITDPELLAREVARTRERGWAQAVGEREEDLNAVAAPVLDVHGELTAILGLQGPSARFGQRAMRTAVAALVAHAEQLSTRAGR
jgi:IclR family acetate operon transcriptional repressor